MTPELYEKAGRLYDAALEIDMHARTAFLDREFGADHELRREVESLLAAHDKVGNYFAAPALEVAAGMLTERQNLSLMGRSLSHYRVLSLIGAGGMGEVYLAEDTRLGRKVALKMLPKEFTEDRERVKRFEQEARAASALNHPNIVTIYEVGQIDGRHFIATEYIEGETLRRRLTSGQIDLREAVEISAQMAGALAAAHEAGIVHRDIKPENVMVRRDGLVKVLDFGLAKLAERRRQSKGPDATTEVGVQSTPGLVMGTLSYMSPEQARGERLDQRTDIFSLGIVMYEMVAGQSPFAASSGAETLAAILEREPKPLAQFVNDVPAELEHILEKSLRKNRDERYETAGELALDLKGLKQEIEVEARMNRTARPESESRSLRTTGSGQAAVSTLENATVRTDDLATGRTMSSAEYLISEVKRRKVWMAIAAAVLIAVAAIAYYFYPRSSGKVINSVAVLPFVNAAGDPNTEYLSDGISDSIINSLSRLPNLRITSLNTVLRYKGKQVDPQAVGRELNVEAVLMGRMTQRGDDLAISTELVDVRDNRRLWGEQYNRKLSDILVVQEEIARQISSGLRLQLSGEEKKRLAKQYTENPDAYQLYILGLHYFRMETKEAYEKAIGFFEQAIKIDPDYALAYVGLARIYHWMGTRGFWPTKESEQKSEWALLKALQLDDSLADAHARLGGLRFNNFDWAGAEKELKRALELDPNSAEANGAYFQYLSGIGRANEALSYAIRADELNPEATPGGLVAFACFNARQYDKAIELYRKNIEKNPDGAHGHILLGETYVAKGMADEGVAMMQKGVALDVSLAKTPERWDRYPMLAYAYAAAGRRREALKILDEQKRLAKQRYVSPLNFVIIYTGLGDKDRAFEWLERGIEQRTRLIYRIKARPIFDPLRSDPRYAELVRRMGLEP